MAAQWTKFGNNRTYLNSPDGIRAAWIDNRTGAVNVEDEVYRAAVDAWLCANGRPGAVNTSAQATAPVATSAAAEPAPPDVDLAANRPGQGVRTRADEELAAMRSRSRIGTAFARVFDVNTDERQWRVGAKGEESVGGRLEKLKAHGWHVLHSVPIGVNGADIDHLLIGPGGIWTINTKNHRGKTIRVSGNSVRVDGFPQPYVRNSEFEADRVRRILCQRLGWEPFVKAALVLLTGSVIPQVVIKSEPANVNVLDRMDIPGAFKRSDQRLTVEQVTTIFEIARWQSTWATRSM